MGSQEADADAAEGGGGGGGDGSGHGEGWAFRLRLRCTISRHSTGSSSSPSSPLLRASADHWDHVHANATAPTPKEYQEIAERERNQAEHAGLDAQLAVAEGKVADAAAALWFQQQAEHKANAALFSAAINKGQRLADSVVGVPSPSLRSSAPSVSYWQWKQSPAGRRAIRQHSKHVDALYSHDRKGVAKSVDEIETDLRTSINIVEHVPATVTQAAAGAADVDGGSAGSSEPARTAAEMLAELDGRALARRSIHVQL